MKLFGFKESVLVVRMKRKKLEKIAVYVDDLILIAGKLKQIATADERMSF